MTNSKKELIDLVGNIINQELNETERQNYEIEGEELIDRILKIERTDIVNRNIHGATNFDFGLSPNALDLIEQSISFSSVIVSIFNIYLEIKKTKKSTIETKTSSFELKEKVYKSLMDQDLPNDLKEKIKEKYSTQLLNIFDKLI
jgi:hypothetical protein